LISCLRFFVCFFSFSFFSELVTVCVVNALIKGRLRTGVSKERWMVAPWCDGWLTTWCGLTLGRVFQVQVAA
jgi:hypothetical protein